MKFDLKEYNNGKPIEIKGLHELKIFDYANGENKNYTLYIKNKLDWIPIESEIDYDYFEEVENEVDGVANIISEGNKKSRGEQGYSQFSNAEIENGTTTTGNDGVSNNNKGKNNKQEYSDTESIGNQKQELDNSSFFVDNQGRILTKEQQEYFKDSKSRVINSHLFNKMLKRVLTF